MCTIGYKCSHVDKRHDHRFGDKWNEKLILINETLISQKPLNTRRVTMMKMDDFTKQAKDKYDDLCKQEEDIKKQIAEIQAEKRALKAYLVEKGIIAKQTRKKRIPPVSN